jgi:hypothetical protein
MNTDTLSWRIVDITGRRHPYHLKAKIVRIHSKCFQPLPLDTKATTLFQCEQPSIFHLLNMRKRRVSRLINSVIDTDGITQTSTKGILRTFFAFLQRTKYDTIKVDDGSVTQQAWAVHRTLAKEWRDYLDMSITAEELRQRCATELVIKLWEETESACSSSR